MKTLARLSIKALTLVSFALTLLLGSVGATAAETITYFHNDVSGTPLLATDTAGNILWKENYRPYGDKLNNAPASAGNKVGFAGKPFDNATGLSYMGARYYDPAIGRFMGIDPKGFDPDNLQSFNRYAYANNNPYKFVDPDGKMALPAALLTGGVILIGGGYIACPGCQKSVAALGRGLEGFASGAVDGARNLLGIVFNESASGTNSGEAKDGEKSGSKDGAKDPAKPVREKGVPNRGEPGEVKEGERRTREYGHDGKPSRDYDKPHQGYEKPHVHEWLGGAREHPGRDYSPWPKQ